MKGVIKKYDIFSLLVLVDDNTNQVQPWLNEQLAYLLQSPSHVIINTYGLASLSPEVIESFVFFENELILKNKMLQFVYFPEDLKLTSPLTKSFKFSDSFGSAIASFSGNQLTQKTQGKIHFIKAFVDACIRVIFIQSRALSRRGKISLKTTDREILSGPISGVIKVASPEYPYEIIISFTENCYLNLISAMLGEKQTKITDENRDGATEILNIIYGQAKLVLNQQNALIAPQIPVLHSGLTYHDDQSNIVVIPFDSDYGEFCIEVRTPKDTDIKKFFT